MYSIDERNVISMIRGDTAEFDIELIDDEGDVYELVPGDVITFTVKKNTLSSDVLIQKEGPHISILPEDTSGMAYGTYKYDVQFTSSGGSVDTVIPPTTFKLLEEVTW